MGMARTSSMMAVSSPMVFLSLTADLSKGDCNTLKYRNLLSLL